MPTSRDFLFLFAALAIAGCLIMAGIVIYPDDRQRESGVCAAIERRHRAHLLIPLQLPLAPMRLFAIH
jgi:hypothetical protein